MKALSLAAVLVAVTPLAAQQTGVSHPPETTIEDTATVSTGQTTETNVPVVTAPAVVVQPSKSQAATPGAAYSDVPTITSQETSPAVTLKRHETAQFDPDGSVVGDVPQRADELGTGTMLRMRLKRGIETATTQEGTPFTAEITEPVMHMGHVVVPSGSTVEGRVTEIRGGKRFRGAAMIHLQAQNVVLPDGTRMPISASVIDTDQYANTRIDAEGNVVRKDHAGQTLAEMSLATGGAAAAGGVLGGVPGALIGAGIGAGVGTVMWLKQDRQTQLPADTLLVMALTSPAPIRSLVKEPEYSSVYTPVQTRQPLAAPSAPVAEQSFVPTN